MGIDVPEHQQVRLCRINSPHPVIARGKLAILQDEREGNLYLKPLAILSPDCRCSDDPSPDDNEDRHKPSLHVTLLRRQLREEPDHSEVFLAITRPRRSKGYNSR